MSARYVIVGSGIAGLSAAEAIRDADPDADITIVSEEPHPFYSRPGLAYFLRNDIPETQLHVRSPRDLRSLSLRRHDGIIERIDVERHEAITAAGKSIHYDRLLLATGALASAPTFPGCDLAGVVKLDGLNDARKILKLVRKREPAVVVGGGITALELAEGLAARGMRVHYFLRGTRYWSDVLDETESGIVMKRLAHEGITIHTETQVQEAIGAAGQLVAVTTQTGQRVPCRVLAVAIGVRPRIDLAKATGLKVNKGIVVDAYLRTGAPDIYAAGDVAEVTDPATGKAQLDVLWPIALAQGRVAGANMAGANIAYRKETPHNVTMLAGLRVAIIGAIGGGGKNDDLVAVSRGESERWRNDVHAALVADQHDANRFRLLVGERTLVGALVMGDQTPARYLKRIIAEQVDITSIRPTIMSGGEAALHALEALAKELDLKNAAAMVRK